MKKLIGSLVVVFGLVMPLWADTTTVGGLVMQESPGGGPLIGATVNQVLTYGYIPTGQNLPVYFSVQGQGITNNMGHYEYTVTIPQVQGTIISLSSSTSSVVPVGCSQHHYDFGGHSYQSSDFGSCFPNEIWMVHD